MNLKQYIKKAKSMPIQVLVKKVLNKIDTKVKDKLQKSRDLETSTSVDLNVSIVKNSYIDIIKLDTSNIDINVAEYLSKMYCEHRFDLLGSGWIENSCDSVALGVEGYQYNMNKDVQNSKLTEGNALGCKIQNYTPIDWQKDYKSGYRWSEKTWYKDIKFGSKLGVDVKVPWELARLQHLPQLAIFCLVDKNLKDKNLKEFKYQILDFINNNPPRMGVNWVCTMDVAIRAANMLVAYDMFTQMDEFKILDDEFKQIFSNSIYEHGLHIINNLEIYSNGNRNNHYLSNITGLLYIASYLENNDEVNEWLIFSIKEIINEMDYQFYEDGGNFESSTSYHRLGGELMIYATALILSVPNIQSKLSQNYIDKLYKIGRFTVDITKENGNVPQFGDNDSGRFFKFSPNGSFITNKEAVNKYLNLKGYTEDDELFWDENTLNHTNIISAINSLFDDDIFTTNIQFEKSFISTLSSNKKLTVQDYSYQKINECGTNNHILEYTNKKEYDVSLKNEKVNFIAYPNSGIYIFKARNFYLSINIMPLGQNENGGHKHNDSLSYELVINNEEIEKDPGTYLYTAIASERDKFRSINAHNVPIIKEIEHNSYNGSFALVNESKAYVNYCDSKSIELTLEYKGIHIKRNFTINENSLIITDKCNQNFCYKNFSKYSNGYGKVENI